MISVIKIDDFDTKEFNLEAKYDWEDIYTCRTH